MLMYKHKSIIKEIIFTIFINEISIQITLEVKLHENKVIQEILVHSTARKCMTFKRNP